MQSVEEISGSEVQIGDIIIGVSPVWQSGFWKVVNITSTGIYLIHPDTGQRGMAGTTTRFCRKITELQYDPTQQGDLDEDI